MRVIHISKVTGIAGSEGHLLRLLPGLMVQGIDAQMVILEEPERPADSYVAALETRNVPTTRLPIRSHADIQLPGLLRQHFRNAQPDLVHTHLIHADLYGLPAANRAGVAHAISSRHNDDAFRRQPLIRWLNQRAMGKANRVIAISEAVGRFVRNVEGITADKVVTVHYGLEPPKIPLNARADARARLGIANDVLLIGAFGRLVAQKGFDVLLDAAARVREAHPAMQLVIVGDGPLRADLEAQAASLNLGDTVTFAGWIDDARTLMPACDIITVPSRWEGFGLVTLEAMGYSVPLVASRASALPEIIINGETGLLVPPEDARTLADALTRLFADSSLRDQLGKAGCDRLHDTFSVERMVQATLDVYQSVLK